MVTIPQELNWVEKRAACTIAKMFNQLCDGIMVDVAILNTVMSLGIDDRFLANTLSDGMAMAVGQPNRMPRFLTHIVVEGNRIVVRHQPAREQEWFVTVGLNDQGRCILRLTDNTELEQWQFRKKALESLFFGSQR